MSENILNQLWIYSKKHLPDCRYCFKHSRTFHGKRPKGLRICYSARLYFWQLRLELEKYNKENKQLRESKISVSRMPKRFIYEVFKDLKGVDYHD